MIDSSDPKPIPCDQCRDVVERPNVPHVVRKCRSCGREVRIVEPGEDGRGIRMVAGDTFVIPAGHIKLAFSPLQASGFLTRHGLDALAQHIFLDGLFQKEGEYSVDADALEERMCAVVNASPLVKPRDVNAAEDWEPVWAALSGRKELTEHWALLAALFLSLARDARAEKDADKASWATACAERCRMMVVHKQHLEEAVLMGQSARRLLDALAIWSGHRANASEEFWQRTFNDHSYVLSQVFAVPVVFVQEKAYMGGMKLDRTGGKYLDYLFAAEASSEVLLVEIKTPTARLLGAEYRSGVYAPSPELGGAVVQALTYRNHLAKNLQTLAEGTPHELKAFKPRCVVVVGDGKSELASEEARRSFELFRSSCEVEIVTFDEVFRKAEILAELFGLKKKTTGSA